MKSEYMTAEDTKDWIEYLSRKRAGESITVDQVRNERIAKAATK